MRILILSIFLLSFIACHSGASHENSKMVDLNVEEFKTKMNDPNVILLDVRTPKETAQGIIQNAMLLDIKQKDFRTKIQALDKEKTILVYCKSGGRSVKACRILEENGFDKIYNLEGGYTAWSKQ